MPLLSADDVLNKTFTETRFRAGYDQDEVDHFLDVVVESLRAAHAGDDTTRTLRAENEELRTRLAAAEARISELSPGSA